MPGLSTGMSWRILLVCYRVAGGLAVRGARNNNSQEPATWSLTMPGPATRLSPAPAAPLRRNNSQEQAAMPGPGRPSRPGARATRLRWHCASENGIYRWLTSQQARARVLLKDFRIADVASQRLDGPVA
jgi:hypothetical protein